MHDARLEDLIRRSLRDEADQMAVTITTHALERGHAERRARVSSSRRVLAAAAIAAVALTGGALLMSRLVELPPFGATPSPSASPAPSATPRPLPDADALLVDVPDVTLRLEDGAGPAAGPAAPSGSLPPGASPGPFEVGRLTFTGPFVIAVACIGQGQILAEITTPTYDMVYTQAVAPCDGTTVLSEYLAVPMDPASPGDIVTVTVSEGTSWRLAIGEYPASLMTPPTFEPIELTAGWTILTNNDAALVSDRSGARVTPPQAATRIGVIVQCIGEGSASLSIPGSPATDVPCDAVGTTHRVEYPIVGGDAVGVTATVDGARVWLRIVVETDAELASTFGPVPDLPAAIAAAPYTAPDQNVLAFGTLGADRQTVITFEDSGPGTPDGDFLPVATYREATGARLDLVSIASGEVLRTLATPAAPRIIFDSWADSTHGLVYYALATAEGIEFHRVTTAGTGDTVIATVARDTTGFTADLALDDSVFVVDACTPSEGCVRTIAGGASRETRRVEHDAEPICAIFGIADGTLIGTSRPQCSVPSTTTVLAVSIDRETSTTLLVREISATLEGAFVVGSAAGPKLVFPSQDDAPGAPWEVLDVATGTASAVPVEGAGGVPLAPLDLRLPDGWLLLTGGSLGDFPWQRAFDRPVPVLVNLVTGERIELVNLPNWTGNL